jgi:hypothetical protein
MEEYFCLKCGRNLEKSELISKPLDPPKVFDGKKLMMSSVLSLPITAEYYCRKHIIPIEVINI